MAVFNTSCLNVQRDPETGCAYDCGGSNDYEACRQNYYLKQQNEIRKSQPEGKPTVNSEPVVTDPKAADAETQQLTEQQDQRIDQLVVGVEKLNQRVDGIYLVLILSLIAIALTTACALLLSRRGTKL